MKKLLNNILYYHLLKYLGYDTKDPLELSPEYDADINRKGEKVDYAILINKQPIILIEAKHWEEKLDKHITQIKKYYNQTPTAKIAILTNGIEYKFYCNIISKDKSMLEKDDVPFL